MTTRKSKQSKAKPPIEGKKRRTIHVKDAKSARRLLSRLLTQLQVELQKDRLNLAAVRAAINGVSELVGILRTADFERRLEAVEKTLSQGVKDGLQGKI